MGITANSKPNNKNNNKGLGFLLVFFPEDTSASATATTTTVDNSPCSSSSSAPSPKLRVKRHNSNNLIMSKAQSTLISICFLLLFFTLLLFAFSIPDPSLGAPRRLLSHKSTKTVHSSSRGNRFFWFSGNYRRPRNSNGLIHSPFALQGMGKLYRRGTGAMKDLIVGHVVEDTNEEEFRLFLRVLHRSGVTSKADIAFIFGSSLFQSRFDRLIQEENDSFFKLTTHYMQSNLKTRTHSVLPVLSFDVTRFVRSGESKETGENLWGKSTRVNNSSNESVRELTRLSYGSVVGFEASELDPENSLAGFLDHVSMSLRRWACYPMLLGRVRRKFKHVMFVNVKNTIVLGDPFHRVKSLSSTSVYVSSSKSSTKHGSDKIQLHTNANSVDLMGGMRGIRRFSNAMLTEIVRVTMQHKKKGAVAESTILNQLVGNGHLLKNVDLIFLTEPIPSSSSLAGSTSVLMGNYPIIQVSNPNHDHISSIVKRQICSSEIDSFVYSDCYFLN